MTDGFQVAGDGFVVLPGDEPQAVAYHMHDAQLDAGFLIHSVDGVREAFQPVDTGDENIVQTAVFEFCQHIEPELRVLIFGQPHTRQFLLAFGVDTQRQEYGFIDDATVLPDSLDDTVKINYGLAFFVHKLTFI